MSPLLWLGIRSILFSLILTPVFRDIFGSYGVVDRPDQGRKLHSRPIPRVGGIAITISYFVSFFLIHPNVDSGVAGELSLVWRLFPAALLIFAVGLIDDFFGLKPWQKIIGQLAAAALAYWEGVRILNVAGYSTQNWWSLPLTLLWLLACTNAFNLVDGLDGLAAGVGLFATMAMFTAGILQHNMALAFATLPLAGCLLGFLCYNFNPATIFLGDCGSLMVGFLLGCYGVIWSSKSVTLLGMTAPLMALAIPLLDAFLCIVRRFLRHQPIFSADRGHIHHRLLDRGFTPLRVALVLYGICGMVAVFSLIQTVARDLYLGTFLVVFFCVVAWIGVSYLGYAEFVFAGRMLRGAGFRQNVNAQLQLRAFENSISQAKTGEDCWQAIRNSSRSFGFRGIRFCFEDMIYEDWDARIQPSRFWNFRIALPEGNYIELAREFGCSTLPMIVGPFVDLLHKSLAARLSKVKLSHATEEAVAPLHGFPVARANAFGASEPMANSG